MPLQPWIVAQTPMTGYPVHSVQHLLRAHKPSISSTFVDGIYGPGTAAAVKAFQQTKGLPQTGKVNKPTWLKLIKLIKKGSTGPAVLALQEVIKAQQIGATGSSTVVLDGKFGPKTEAWVKGWQKFQSLNPDGQVGVQTWQSVMSGLPF